MGNSESSESNKLYNLVLNNSNNYEIIDKQPLKDSQIASSNDIDTNINSNFSWNNFFCYDGKYTKLYNKYYILNDRYIKLDKKYKILEDKYSNLKNKKYL